MRSFPNSHIYLFYRASKEGLVEKCDGAGVFTLANFIDRLADDVLPGLLDRLSVAESVPEKSTSVLQCGFHRLTARPLG